MKRGVRNLTLLMLVLVLGSGCGGWYPRGTHQANLTIKKVFLVIVNAFQVGQGLNSELYYNNVQRVSSSAAADVIIELKNEKYERRVLSVDPDTGKVREIELSLQVEVTVRRPDGHIIQAPDKLTWVRDFVFDEGSLLGTEETETTIRLELGKDAAKALMIKLETVDFEKPKS